MVSAAQPTPEVLQAALESFRAFSTSEEGAPPALNKHQLKCALEAATGRQPPKVSRRALSACWFLVSGCAGGIEASVLACESLLDPGGTRAFPFLTVSLLPDAG